jgi:hypothetical protein
VERCWEGGVDKISAVSKNEGRQGRRSVTPSLPRNPDLRYLKKQAKRLLAAQRSGLSACCPILREIGRYARLSDAELFQAPVTLAEARLALAIHYGYASWRELVEEVRSRPAAAKYSLRTVQERAEKPIPEYAGAGVPMAVVAALNHAGIPVRYMEFAAASGWAFSFGYLYDDISPAFLGVRGNPEEDGPFEVFSFLPRCHGLGYEMALTSDHEGLWRFVTEHVDAGTPVMSEHMDGGLIAGYRENDGSCQIFLDGTVSPAWIAVDGLQPHAVYAFVREGRARGRDEITAEALSRAVAKGKEHEWKGVPQGLSALRRYLADVSDLSKDFRETPEWFCWAAFQRLMARRCAQVWLASVAGTLPRSERMLLEKAASAYGAAFRYYDRYLGEVRESSLPRHSRRHGTRSAERIWAIVPLLAQGIGAEERGLDHLEEVVSHLA